MRRILFFAAVAVLALAGAAYGAGTITGSSIKDSTITGRDVRDKSLTRKDFRGSVRGPRGFTGDAGPQGPQGPQGPGGPQGPAGPSVVGQLTVVDGPQEFFGPSDVVVGAIAFCPPGQRAVSGGGVSVTDEQLAATEATNDRSGWFVIGVDRFDDGGEYVQAQAVCGPAGSAVAASSSHARARAQLGRRVALIARGRLARRR